MKRVITFINAEGRGALRLAEAGARDLTVTALGWREVWATFPEDGSYPHAAQGDPTGDARWRSVYPGPGQTIFRVLEYRPDEAPADGPYWSATDLKKISTGLPGLMESLDPDEPGMHATKTVDYGVVLNGRIVLELDGGQSIELEPGDVVVQNGARHAWRPIGRVTMAFVQVGVDVEAPTPDHALP